MMTSRSCGGVARAGPRRATSDPSSCRSTRHSTSSPPRASSGSVLNLQSVTKRANSSSGATAEQPLSGPDEVAAGIASKIAVAEGEPAGTSWIRGLGGTKQAEGRGIGTLEAIRSVPPDALGSDDRERLRHEEWPGAEASVTGAAGADASPDRDGATASGDRERPRFGGFSSLPRGIAFAALYAAAVAA